MGLFSGLLVYRIRSSRTFPPALGIAPLPLGASSRTGQPYSGAAAPVGRVAPCAANWRPFAVWEATASRSRLARGPSGFGAIPTASICRRIS